MFIIGAYKHILGLRPWVPAIQSEAEARDAKGAAEDAVAARDRAQAAKTLAEAELATAQRQALEMRAQIRKVGRHGQCV